MRKIGIVLVSVCFLGCAHEHAASPQPESPPLRAHSLRVSEGPPEKLLTLKQILQRMRDSPRTYDVGEASAPLTVEDREKLAEQYWGSSVGAYVPEVTTDATGATHVENAKTNPQVVALLKQAETPYQKKDFAAAEAIYAQALAIDPHDYQSLLARGECEAYQGHLDEGLRSYEQAIAANPRAHVGWEYKGELLLALGRRDEALDAYAHALALRPRWKALLTHLKNREEHLGIQIASERLLPAVRVTRTEKGARIELDPKHTEWLGFGACKALWLDDPDHRREVTGTTERRVTSSEERECLGALLTGYASLHEKNGASDPKLDEVLEIAKAGAFEQLLEYEVLSRADGNLASELPEELFEKLVRYVRWYVLVDRRVSER